MTENVVSINSPGWDGLDAARPPVIGRDVQNEIDILYRRCFSTEAGQKVLAHLKERYEEPDTWVPGEPESFGYARSAQRRLVKEIEQRINRTNEP